MAAVVMATGPSDSSLLRRHVLDVAEAVRLILLALDFTTVDALLLVLQRDPSGAVILQDRRLWRELLHLHFKADLPAELMYLALPSQPRAWSWQMDTHSCAELRHFLRSGDERAQFQRVVHIVRGDIGHIQHVNEIAVDGLAFPTNSALSNHFIGAAGAIFKRVGVQLNQFVSDPAFRRRRNVGDAVATPAFDATGTVRRLIHCVGPRISQDDCFERLAETYENAMHTALREELTCVALASISTGAMGVPLKEGAMVALRAVQRFLRMHPWQGTLGIVCFEANVFDAFQGQYEAVLDGFNEPLVYPEVTADMWG